MFLPLNFYKDEPYSWIYLSASIQATKGEYNLSDTNFVLDKVDSYVVKVLKDLGWKLVERRDVNRLFQKQLSQSLACSTFLSHENLHVVVKSTIYGSDDSNRKQSEETLKSAFSTLSLAIDHAVPEVDSRRIQHSNYLVIKPSRPAPIGFVQERQDLYSDQIAFQWTIKREFPIEVHVALFYTFERRMARTKILEDDYCYIQMCWEKSISQFFGAMNILHTAVPFGSDALKCNPDLKIDWGIYSTTMRVYVEDRVISELNEESQPLIARLREFSNSMASFIQRRFPP